METKSTVLKPRDSRCKWWCKLWINGPPDEIRLDTIVGANALPGEYQIKGADVELPPWSLLFDGEEVSHRKNRGWAFNVGIVVKMEDGSLRLAWRSPMMAHKMTIKTESRNDASLMCGSGDHAAMARIACWILRGRGHEERLRRARLIFDLPPAPAPPPAPVPA